MLNELNKVKRMSKSVRWKIIISVFIVCEVLKTLFLYQNYRDWLFIGTHVLFDFVFVWSMVQFLVPIVQAIKNDQSSGAALLWLIIPFLDIGLIWFATEEFFVSGKMPAYGIVAPVVLLTWKSSIHENKEK